MQYMLELAKTFHWRRTSTRGGLSSTGTMTSGRLSMIVACSSAPADDSKTSTASTTGLAASSTIIPTDPSLVLDSPVRAAASTSVSTAPSAAGARREARVERSVGRGTSAIETSPSVVSAADNAGDAARELGAGDETLLLLPKSPPRPFPGPAFLSTFFLKSPPDFFPPRLTLTTDAPSDTSSMMLVPASLAPSRLSLSSSAPATGSSDRAKSVVPKAKTRGRNRRRNASSLSLSAAEMVGVRSRKEKTSLNASARASRSAKSYRSWACGEEGERPAAMAR